MFSTRDCHICSLLRVNDLNHSPWLGSVLLTAGEGAEGGRVSLEFLRLRGRVEQPDGCFGEEEVLRASGLVPEPEAVWVGVALL